MTEQEIEEATDKTYCRDEDCECDWRQSQVERESKFITLSFYCTKCLCLTFMNFNTEHEHHNEAN